MIGSYWSIWTAHDDDINIPTQFPTREILLRGEHTFWDVRAFVKSVLVISDTYLSWDIELLDLQ